MTALAHPRSGVGRVFEHRLLQYRRSYRASIFSSFLTPVLFLAAMGLGLGTYVDGSSNQSLGGLSYIAFLAPGLLAATCMQSAAFEAAFPIMAGLVWSRVFHAMYATPINGRDIALGNLAWIGARMLLVATVFTAVIVLFGAASSPLVVLAIPVAALTGLAFAAPIMAFSATQRSPEKFNAVFRFGITPLFLFSGTFYPVESLPTFLQPLAWVTPLWHGVSLARGLSLGTVGDAPLLALVHLAVLLGFLGVGAWFAVRTVSAKLVRG
ncbi:MAG: ABC transporter permease [Candidatus Limnocylindrales bacterium]